MQQTSSNLITLSPSSPSFNSYSSGKLDEIAARVVKEFSTQSDSDANIFPWEPPPLQQESNLQYENDDEAEDDDDDFEFAILGRDHPDTSSISADEIFYNGQIRSVYPLFNTALLLDPSEEKEMSKTASSKPTRLPLGKLFNDERETTSCSSSEADDLENVPAGTYCVWTPKKGRQEKDEEEEEESPALSSGKCKKSSSTGTSKRWNKFRELLYRSNSDGKDTFVFVAPAPGKKIIGEKGKEERKANGKDEKHVKRGGGAVKDEKRRSYLPFRQDLIGFLGNVHGVGLSSRNLHPF